MSEQVFVLKFIKVRATRGCDDCIADGNVKLCWGLPSCDGDGDGYIFKLKEDEDDAE